MPDKSDDPVVRDCIVKLLDDHGVEHSVKIPASSVYEAALRGNPHGKRQKIAPLVEAAGEVSA